MPRSSQTFRIFISSTFSDLRSERTALQHWVFPRLDELCIQNGARFQPIDLRWGVSGEASLSQEAMNICLSEVARCQRVSPQLNFVILLGERYGACPAPFAISQADMDALSKELSAEDRNTLLWRDGQPEEDHGWYRLDTNANPAMYLLQPRSGIHVDDRAWVREEKKLRDILARQIHRVPAERHVNYLASATEQEIHAGLFSVPGAEKHVTCYLRQIHDLPAGEQAREYQDLKENGEPDLWAHERILMLRDRLRSKLGGNCIDFSASWTEKGPTQEHIGSLPDRLDDCLKLLEQPAGQDTLCEAIWRRLALPILGEVAQSTYVPAAVRETSAHAAVANEHIQSFTGRESLLQEIEQYVNHPQSRLMVIHGESGVGKSAIMAMAASPTRRGIRIARFIGLTPNSSYSTELLHNLCQVLQEQYPSATPADLNSEDLAALSIVFRDLISRATEQQPLVLFLDALDQLTDQEGRKLGWLPAVLPPNVALIVSVIDGEMLSSLQDYFREARYLCVPKMGPDDGRLLLDKWLADSHRTLMPDQYQKVLQAFGRNGLPLYLRLAVTEANRWHSYDPPYELPGTTGGLIEATLSRLRQDVNHGAVMVQRSTAFLALSRFGLSESEILQVLWEDVDVQNDFWQRYPKSPRDVDQLPVAVWARLYFDLEPYTAERPGTDASLISFYNKQMDDYVEACLRQSGEATRRHRQLATLFEHQACPSGKPEWETAQGRSLNELAYHLLESRDSLALRRLYEDPAYLQSLCTNFTSTGEEEYLGIRELLINLSECVQVYQDTTLAGQWQGLHQLLSERSTLLSRFPSAAQQEIANYLPFTTQKAYSKVLYERARDRKERGLELEKPPSLTRSLSGHSGAITSLAVSVDEKYFLSGDMDGSVGYWSLDEKDPRWLVNAHQSWVGQVSFSADGKEALSCSDDAVLYLWDLRLGTHQQLLKVPMREQFLACRFLDKNTAIVLSSGTLYYIDLRTYQSTKYVLGGGGIEDPSGFGRHALEIDAVKKRVYCRDGEEIRVFDLATRSQIGSVEHPSCIDILCTSHDGNRLLVLDEQKYCSLYDVTGQPRRLSRVTAPPTDSLCRGTPGTWLGASIDHYLVRIELLEGDKLKCEYGGKRTLGTAGGIQDWKAGEQPTDMTFLPSASQLLIGTSSGEIYLQAPVPKAASSRSWGSSGSIERGAIAPDGQSALALAGGTFAFIRPDGTMVRSDEFPHRLPITGIAYAEDDGNTAFTIDQGGNAARWEDQRPVWNQNFPGNVFTALTVSLSTNEPVAGTQEDQVFLITKRKAYSVASNGLAFHTGVKALAVAGQPETYFAALQNGEICIRCGEELWSESVTGRHDYHATCVALDRAASLAACGTVNGQVIVWNVHSQERILERSVHAGPVLDVAFEEGGQWLLSMGKDKTVNALNLLNGKTLYATVLPSRPLALRLGRSLVHILLVNGALFSFRFAAETSDGQKQENEKTGLEKFLTVFNKRR